MVLFYERTQLFKGRHELNVRNMGARMRLL